MTHPATYTSLPNVGMAITVFAHRRRNPLLSILESSKTHRSATKTRRILARTSDVADLVLEFLELLLEVLELLGHVLVLGLPLVPLGLQRLHLAFEVTGFYVSLAEPAIGGP